MKTITLFFAAIGLMMASSLTAQNAVNNGDFELSTWVTNGSTPQEWTTNNTGMTNSRTVAVNGITPTQGTYMFSMKCNQNNAITSAILLKPNAAGGIVIQSGTKYIFSFKVYTVQGGSSVPKMAFKMYAASPAQYVVYFDNTSSYFNVTPGSWQTFSYPFTATNTLAAGSNIPINLGFFLNGNEANTTFYLDEVSILPESGTTVINVLSDPEVAFTNPVENICKISKGVFKSAQVYNLAGSLMLNAKIDSKNEIDFSTLAQGCYTIKLIGDTQKTVKVIKK